MGLPLEGITVADLTHWGVGSITSGLFAEWGAKVIHIERPDGGDPLRGIGASGVIAMGDMNYLWALVNRNKKSLAVDLKKETGKRIVHELIESADVCVSNFRYGALEKLGLDYDTLRQINPGLIYGHANAYGQKGPESERGGFDETAFWARGGVMGVLGEPDAPPVPLHGAIGDFSTSLFLASGLILALRVRDQTGKGQRVDTSLLGSGVWAAACDVQATLTTGQGMRQQSRTEKTNPLHNTYRTKDGKWIQFAMLQTDPIWPDFCRALGRPDLEHELMFASHEKRGQNNELLISVLDEIISTRARDEWIRRFDEYGLIYAPVSSITDVVNDPQVLENGYITEVDDPRYGLTKLVDCPIQLRGTPGKVRDLGPELGQHTEEILLEMGYTWDDIVSLREQKVIG